MEQTVEEGNSCTSVRQAPSNALYLRQLPEKVWRYTFRKFGSSHRSTDPPSTWGESPSELAPGGRLRIRSAYTGTSSWSKWRRPSLSAIHNPLRNVRTLVRDSDCLARTWGRDQ